MGLETKIARGIVTGFLTAGAVMGLEGSTGRVSAVEADGQPRRASPATTYPPGTEVTLEMKDGSRVTFCQVGSDLPGMYGEQEDERLPIPFPEGGSIGLDKKTNRLMVLDAQGEPVAVYAEIDSIYDKDWTEPRYSDGTKVGVWGHRLKPGVVSPPIGWVATEPDGERREGRLTVGDFNLSPSK
ncbi:MAG: hypothetical protein A2784_01865 [Candidatus Chisholmbacteria bacterium RIFCSPHIGHO2_01_FULL_48_12]|uniref:Uncharacterized protein n=1 Tax=Candidatus Chisholmbacteria bacterium RIFCSPHIGHO2_01_FULL_48_12 TaxID=1797589 RepID=A0A1G1VR92_9BACT|nr:MAG: hypothetical protein A2784_01865 [Candidatus Chisholmbacteria bacterium RIFCSPHIGHO2_01_FULL_48_12]